MDIISPTDDLIGDELPEPDPARISTAAVSSITAPSGKSPDPPKYEIVNATPVNATKYEPIEELVYSVSTQERERPMSAYDDAVTAAEESEDSLLQPDGYTEKSREVFEPPTTATCSNCGGKGSVSRTCPDCGGSGEYRCDNRECRGGTIVHTTPCNRCAERIGGPDEDCPVCSNDEARAGQRVINKETCPNCKGRGRIECTRNHASLTKQCPDCTGDGEVVKQTVHVHRLERREGDRETIRGVDPGDFRRELAWLPEPETVFEVGAGTDDDPPETAVEAAPELFDVDTAEAVTSEQTVAADGGQREAVLGRRVGVYLPATVSVSLEAAASTTSRPEAIGYYDPSDEAYDWRVKRTQEIEYSSEASAGSVFGGLIGVLLGVIGYIPVFIVALVVEFASVSFTGNNPADWLLWQLSSVPYLLFAVPIGIEPWGDEYFEPNAPTVVRSVVLGATTTGVMTLIHHGVSRLADIPVPDTRWYAASLVVGGATAVVALVWADLSDS
ncbi:MAG: hypothetical protein ABEI75_02070 [Halobaculum sp.]